MDKMQMYRDWADQFLMENTEPMSEGLAKAFMSLSMMEIEGVPMPVAAMQTFQYKIVRGRANSIGLQINDTAVMLVAAIASSPGVAVMYVYALKRRQEKNPADMTVSEIAYTFPNGFLPEESLSRMWDAQKVEGNNLLDTISASDFA